MPGLLVVLLLAVAAPPEFAVDVEASRIYVKVGSDTRLGHEHGVEGRMKSGKLTPGGAGEFVFDMESFTADSAEVRKRVGLGKKKMSKNEAKKVTDAMRGSDVLDVERFPTATLRIVSMKPLDKQEAGKPGAYLVEGRFTLHGVEGKLAFKAKLEMGDKEGDWKLSGTFPLKQTDYGIKPYSALAGLARVKDELEITGELVLKSSAGK